MDVDELRELIAQATESDEERAERLQDTADEAGCDAEGLFELEEVTEEGVRRLVEENDQYVAQLENFVAQVGPMVGLPPDVIGQLGREETIKVLAQTVAANPVRLARTVRTANEVFERTGLYDDLGTEPLPPGELNPEISVGGSR